MGLSIFDERYPAINAITATDSDGTGEVGLPLETPSALRIDELRFFSTALTDHVVEIHIGNNVRPLSYGRVTVPAGAGFGIVPHVEAVALLCPTGKQAIIIPATNSLNFQLDVTLLTGETIDCTAIGGYV